MTEFEIAGILAKEVHSRGCLPAVILIAVDDRIYKYRHPIPTSKKLEKQVMLVLCARLRGLILSCTRIIYFGTPPEELIKKHKAVCTVDGAFIKLTRPGVKISDIFKKAQEMYAETGFGDEWKLHHQGGPCGYEPRDIIATPNTEENVLLHQAFAWNPSITGTKSEDTILVEDEGNIILSEMSEWPMIEVDTPEGKILRPDILRR